MNQELISLEYLQKTANEIWESECASGGDVESSTERLVDYIADDLCSYIPIEYRSTDDWAKPFELLAKRIVAEHVKNFEEYEEQSQGETALQEAELDIRYETMRSL